MKKAKFLLAAIAVVAVAGGAFAFKARQATVLYFRNPAGANPSACTVTKSFVTTDPLVGPFVSSSYFSTRTTAICTSIAPYYSNL